MKARTAVFTVWVSLLACVSQAQNWTAIAPMNDFRDSHGAATGPDGLVYAIGGSQSSRCLDTVEKYDPSLNEWLRVASMNVPRCSPGVVFGADGYIYAIGGDIGNTSTDLVERFNTRTGVWETVAPLNIRRGSPAVAVGPDLRIYAMGGFDEPSSTEVTSIEAFDGTQWTIVPEVTNSPSPRQAVTGIDGNIYAFSWVPATWSKFDGATWTPLGVIDPTSNDAYTAVAGADGMIYLLAVGPGSRLSGPSSALACDLAGNTVPISRLLESRSAPAASMADGRIIINGGYRTSGGVLSNAESYGPIAAPLFQNIKVFFRFDEAGGAIVADEIAGLAGTPVGGPAYNAGPVGVSSLQFNGYTRYVKVNSAAALNPGRRDLTIETWVRWTKTASLVQPILDKREQLGASIRGYHLFLYKGKLGLQLANGTTYRNYVANDVTIPQNEWTHVAVTIDRTANAGVLYVNSIRAGRFMPLSGSVSSNAPLLIGRNSLDATLFRGGVDELTFYDRALQWAEIRAIFLAGHEGKR